LSSEAIASALILTATVSNDRAKAGHLTLSGLLLFKQGKLGALFTDISYLDIGFLLAQQLVDGFCPLPGGFHALIVLHPPFDVLASISSLLGEDEKLL